MENNTIKELSAMIQQLNLVTDKQAQLVMTSDNRIVTEQKLIAENDMLYINGFPEDIQPITTQKTKLRNRLVNLHVTSSDLNANTIELQIQQEINNFYILQGVSLVDISSINMQYNENNLMLLITLLESKLQEKYNNPKKIIASNKIEDTQQKQDKNQNKRQETTKKLYGAVASTSVQFYEPKKILASTQQKYTCKLTNDSSFHTQSANNEIALFFSIKNKAIDEYKISYNFDMQSVLYLKEYVDKKNCSINFWRHKLAFLVAKALGYYIESDISELQLNASQRQTFMFNTKEQAEQAISTIKINLVQEGLHNFSNAYKLKISSMKDRSTKNYPLFRYYRKVLKPSKESSIKSKIDTKELFKNKKILSLADGYANNDKSSEYLAKNLVTTTIPISITTTDIACSPRVKCYSYKDNNNITIKNAQIDNQKSFLHQGLQEKFDLIVMHRGLCNCENMTIDSTSCGGIPMYAPNGLRLFLLRIASVLDTTNKDVKAIITGTNVREYDFWKQDIQEFNTENKEDIVAEIVRNSRGIFKGIIIYNSNI